MTIEMFVKLFNANKKTKNFEEFLNKHITTDYIPFIQKDAICASIIEATSFVKDGDKKIFKSNSTARFILYTMKMIELYTDIDVNFEKFADDYDELNKIGAIGALFNAIPEAERAEFETILNMKLDDYHENEYSLTALLYGLKESFSLSEEVISKAIEEIAKQEQK